MNILLLLIRPNNNTPGPVAGLGGFLLVGRSAGKDTSFTPCAGLGAFLLFARGGGYGRSGLSPAQASQHPSIRLMVGISI